MLDIFNFQDNVLCSNKLHVCVGMCVCVCACVCVCVCVCARVCISNECSVDQAVEEF